MEPLLNQCWSRREGGVTSDNVREGQLKYRQGRGTGEGSCEAVCAL